VNGPGGDEIARFLPCPLRHHTQLLAIESALHDARELIIDHPLAASIIEEKLDIPTKRMSCEIVFRAQLFGNDGKIGAINTNARGPAPPAAHHPYRRSRD
jgi:hypothetical protein